MKRLALCSLVLAACGSSGGGSEPPDATPDPQLDAAIDGASGDKAAACASTFGDVLTNSFGRVDGTIVAVVPPAHPTCAMPNSTHLVVQVMMNGAVYRMVANVQSNTTDHRVFIDEIDAPLAGPAWSEGWHTNVSLDYVSTLHVTSAEFAPQATMADAVDHITDRLEIGAKVSVFSTSSGGTNAGSTHLIHRNATNADGAIVIDPDTNPHYILVRFPDQSF